MQTVLAVDDAKDTIMLLEFDLQAEGYSVITAGDGEAALKILQSESVDLVLLDLYMPGLSGIETLAKMRTISELKNIPVIMLSASDDEDEIVSALEIGAHDYVTKPYIAKVLLARMKNALRLKEKTIKLEDLAKTDFLTGINNKGQFEHLAEKSLSQMSRSNQNVIMAMFDIDHFKAVNDTYGHDAGDTVLKSFAELLEHTFRDYDILGRIGGEEFAVCMPNTSQNDAVNACERFRTSLESLSILLPDNNTSISVTVSIGVSSAQHPEGEFELHHLLKKADQFLYQAKNKSRNTIESHQPIEAVQTQLSEPQEMDEKEKLSGIDYQIGVNNVLGDDNLFKEILKMFYDDHHQDGEKIQQAIEQQDQSRMKHLVHTLKGVSCSIGAMKLFEHSKLLDVAVNDGETSSYQTLFDNVAFELDRVISGIQVELDIR